MSPSLGNNCRRNWTAWPRTRKPRRAGRAFGGVDNDPQKAAECLARPLLVDRLIQGNYAVTSASMASLKSRAQTELTAGVSAQFERDSTAKSSGSADRNQPHPGVMHLESRRFEQRVRELKTLSERASREHCRSAE